MWVVFVLHEFSLGSFGELLTVVSENSMIMNVFYFGLFGMGIMIYWIVVFYLVVQTYVSRSFSLYFWSTCILSLFNDMQINKRPSRPSSRTEQVNKNRYDYYTSYYVFLWMIYGYCITKVAIIFI